MKGSPPTGRNRCWMHIADSDMSSNRADSGHFSERALEAAEIAQAERADDQTGYCIRNRKIAALAYRYSSGQISAPQHFLRCIDTCCCAARIGEILHPASGAATDIDHLRRHVSR